MRFLVFFSFVVKNISYLELCVCKQQFAVVTYRKKSKIFLERKKEKTEQNNGERTFARKNIIFTFDTLLPQYIFFHSTVCSFSLCAHTQNFFIICPSSSFYRYLPFGEHFYHIFSFQSAGSFLGNFLMSFAHG